MPTDVVVCNGCCCGNTDKGHPVVPIDFLTNAWDEKGLNEYVKLRISRCLGPCSMHNVSILRTEESQQWLGNLSQKEHYESIVEWACIFGSQFLEHNYRILKKISKTNF